MTFDGDVILESINIIGPLPSKMWQARANSSTFFKDDGSWLEDRKPSGNENLRPLAVRLSGQMKNELQSTIFGHGDEELRNLENLLRSMLQYEPKDRITVK